MLKVQILTLLLILSPVNFCQSVYSFDADDEVILFGTGLSLGILDNLLLKSRQPFTLEKLGKLSRENVNSFDRMATYNWSPTASTVSDILLVVSIASPLFLLSSSNVHNDVGTFSTMYVENVIFSYSLTYLAKASHLRPRPYVYNETVPMEEKLDIESTLSFFSGHSTMAFSSAVFLSTLYQRYYPDSKFKPYIWGTSLVFASLVAYLRIYSGQHFPSDVIIGAATGCLIGYLIPLMHEHKDGNNKVLLNKINSNNVFSININF